MSDNLTIFTLSSSSNGGFSSNSMSLLSKTSYFFNYKLSIA